VSNHPEGEGPIVTTRPKTTEKTGTRRVPPYNVILENDEHHSVEFVVEVLQKALGFSVERAVQHMLEAHNTGRSVVYTGPKEVAELKLDQIVTCHEIRENNRDLGPLGCYIEPAPGGD
jgi:ATP-dependent Clp protease adaptor protein ClpS